MIDMGKRHTIYLTCGEEKGDEIYMALIKTGKPQLQRWNLDEYPYLRSNTRLYLAVNGNGGRGTRLCTWTKKPTEGGQKWYTEAS